MIRNRPLLALTAAELISQLGSGLSALALPWFVLVTTHSASRMGVVFAVELLPFVLFGLHAGVVVDRLGLRATFESPGEPWRTRRAARASSGSRSVVVAMAIIGFGNPMTNAP